MILACQNISKAFGTDVILDNVSFHIEDHEKAAIIGINGAGKSTLLKIIMHEMSSDSGEVIIAKDKTIGYLAQHQSLTDEHTIYESMLEIKKDILETYDRMKQLEHDMKDAKGEELERMLASYARLTQVYEDANGYAYKSEITGVLKGLGFKEDEFNTPINTLSGGQKTRVALGRLLLSKPDIILLDEPTNHLDMTSIAWLETFLLNYPGAVIIVAHDRYFLDKIVSKVIEIEHHKALMFSGTYTEFAQKKAAIRDAQMKAYLNQQQEIKHQEAVIAKLKSFNREKSIKRAESREKLLNKMERLEAPEVEATSMRIHLEPAVTSGNDVLFVDGLSKSFGDHHLFKDIQIDIKRGEKVALIGNNGTGKTTILKILNHMIPADAGEIRIGAKVMIGYYDQEHQVLHPDKTIFQEISDAYPQMDNTKIRNVLASFLFTNDDVFKPIRELSGGERGRVSLAKLMLSDANFLILDEPTNHLDIVSKEILEEAIRNYTGTVFYVSHDRYFINTTATRILELTGGGLNSYMGNYDDYLEKKDTPLVSSSSGGINMDASAAKNIPDNSGKLDYQQQKQQRAKERKLQNELKKTETRIEAIETRQAELDEMLNDTSIATNVTKLLEINQEKESLDEELTELMEKWEILENEVAEFSENS